jgi:hypothetical protein
MPFFVSKPKSGIHQACRSLVQKAVRRGDVELTRRTARHLQDTGDAGWLRQRTALIVFEECWPLAADLDWAPDSDAVIERLARVARAVKVKDAAGLSSLAYALVNGDASVLVGSRDDAHVTRLAEAISRPGDFWDWAIRQASGDRERSVIESAHLAHRRGGWPWDQACIQAAAYLVVAEGLSTAGVAKSGIECPLWVALDKHTPQGKVVLREVAKREGFPWRELLWTSFYFEGARTNEATDSIWWSREVEWRMGRVGLDQEAGRRLWGRARPFVAEALRAEAESLRRHLASSRSAPALLEIAGTQRP